jgi:AcrR family transcriptional regulator
LLRECAVYCRGERKKAQIRKRLYEVAMELFEEQGSSQTTIEQITERVDVSPATFFNCFPTKEAVLGDYYRANHQELLRRAGELEGRSVRDRFLELSKWQEDRAQKKGRLFKILLQEFLSRPELLAATKETAMASFQPLLGWVEEGKKRGEVRGDLDALLVVKTISNVWNGTMLEWAAAPEWMEGCCDLCDRTALLFDGLTSQD